MMKRLLLFIVGGAMAASASAQQAEVVNSGNTPRIGQLVEKYTFVDDQSTINSIQSGKDSRAAAKTTAPAPRWYTPYDIINALNSSSMDNNRSFVPIWFDSTMYIKYNNNPQLSAVNFASFGQVIDPIGAGDQMFNDVSFNNTNTMWVQDFNAYSVDSVEINVAYIKNKNRPSGVVDTLILALAPQTGSRYYVRSTASWIGTYIPADKDTMFIWRPDADSIGRTISSSDRKVWKEYLTDADRDTVNTQNNTITTRTWRFAVPGGLTVPAGNRVSFTATFKSGDTWTKNSQTDSIQGHHHLRILSSEVTDNALMKYDFYGALKDRNHSSLMFTTDTGRYSVSYPLENANGAQFPYEHHRMGVLISCATCWVLDVKNTEGLLTKGGAYPNPAVSYVHIPFQLTAAADVNVTLTNTVGQVVKSQKVANVSNGQVTFNTSDLTNGLYLYTIEVNGQRSTGRVTVAH
ncbi:MAG: T9SS type A sorting domain-containing protein [Chitinophagaceae bacterium]|nr:T9SS type A sorting domain-containing protein [Chitinophagaceae bacterium]